MRASNDMTISDLIRIQQERMLAYGQIRKWLSDKQLSTLVADLYQQSLICILELRNCSHSIQPDPAGYVQTQGELYVYWGGVPTIKPGCNEYDLMLFCEACENSVRNVYQHIFHNQYLCSVGSQDLLSKQLVKCDQNIERLARSKLIALNELKEHQQACLRH